MLSKEKFELLSGRLEVWGTDYELDESSQYFRDKFPEGIPAEDAIKAVTIYNKDDESFENYALLMLAMVPVHGIETEILDRLKKYKTISPQTKESINERFVLGEALRYLDHPEGLREFDLLKTIVEPYPKFEGPFPMDWFRQFEETLAKWKQDRAAGKRWVIYEDD
jgi:hypothetical protein